MRFIPGFLTIAATAVAVASPAAAALPLEGAISVDWYTVQPGPVKANRDFQNTCCGELRPDMVLGTLGPNGRPMYNAASAGPVIKGVSGTGELQWWTPGTTAGGDVVTSTGSEIVFLPFSDTTLFPTNGAGGSNGGNAGFQTAHFYFGIGNFSSDNLLISFNFEADDDLFLFADSKYVGGLGGVHPITASGPFSFVAAPGTTRVDIFFADRHTTESALKMRATFEVLPGGVIPEPATWALLITGFGLVGMVARRRPLAA